MRCRSDRAAPPSPTLIAKCLDAGNTIEHQNKDRTETTQDCRLLKSKMCLHVTLQ